MTLTLEERYRDDPVLLAVLKKRLLIKGWAGQLDDCEREYLRRMKPPRYAQMMEGGIGIRERQNKASFRGDQGRLEGF